MKGIVAVEILEPFFELDRLVAAPKAVEEALNIADYNSLGDIGKNEDRLDENCDNLSNRAESVGSFDENSVDHEYVNSNQNVTLAKKTEVSWVILKYSRT